MFCHNIVILYQQEELTDTHLQLSEVHGKIEESERELEGLRTSEQQSREKAEKVR